MIKSLQLALAFLTCLIKSPVYADNNQGRLKNSVRFYPLVGLFIGLITTLPTHFLNSYPFFAAFIYILLNFYITRGLHFDGLADFFDAVYSNKQGQAFWQVIKDSRLGAFGCLALIFSVIAYLISISYLISNNFYLPLIIAPIISRSLISIFAYFSTVHQDSLLGQIVVDACPKNILIFNGLLILILSLFIGIVSACLIIILLVALIYKILQISYQQNGFNGDFLGAIIVCSEIIVLCGSLFAITSL